MLKKIVTVLPSGFKIKIRTLDTILRNFECVIYLAIDETNESIKFLI